MAKLKKPNKNATLHKIYHGYITVTNLPKDVYFYNAAKLMKGINKGFGKITFEYNSPDYKLYESIHDNIFMFSGAKTFQETLAMSNELIKDNRLVSFDEFKKSAGQLFDDYNESYLEAEYKTAISGGRMAEKWGEAMRNKKDLPYMKFVTAGDETVCEVCAPLDNICLPSDDDFWDTNYPPLHFRCNCDAQLTDNEDDVSDQSEADVADRESNSGRGGDKTFDVNVGKTGMVFSKDHPYFQIPKEYHKLAENNFNLPIPKNTGRYATL